jgi:hypothetical protein
LGLKRSISGSKLTHEIVAVWFGQAQQAPNAANIDTALLRAVQVVRLEDLSMTHKQIQPYAIWIAFEAEQTATIGKSRKSLFAQFNFIKILPQEIQFNRCLIQIQPYQAVHFVECIVFISQTMFVKLSIASLK